jgi:putative hydrolase of the HAD superfamily
MMSPTHILFDFFGTVVSYSADRIGQGYAQSYQFLLDQGAGLTYDAFVQQWDQLFEQFEQQGEASLVEFSLTDLCRHFLQQTLGQAPAPVVVAAFRDRYLAEWSRGVRYIPGVKEMLAALAARHTLVLLSNTHHAPLVHGHLRQGQMAPCFQHVVTSVEHGQRKPSRQIFAHALQVAGGAAATAVFVGDSYTADYLGAQGAGISCFLIDPQRQHPIPDAYRLGHILALPAAMRGA